MIRTGSAATCVLLAAMVAPAAAQDSSRVVMVRDGKTIELRHVKGARYVPDGGEAEIKLLFASEEPAGVVLVDDFGRDNVGRWVQERGALAVKITFEEGSPEHFQMAAYTGETMISGGGTASGEDRVGVFRAVDIGADRIAGELDHEMASVALSGRFSVSLARAAEAPAVTGAAVAASPQAAALLGFARAMQRMDLAAAQQYGAGDVRAEMEEAREMLGEGALKAMIEERFGDPAALERRLASEEASLQVSGESAVIRLVKKTVYEDGHSTETESYRFVKVGDAWKITM
jgi:hypothetical protein